MSLIDGVVHSTGRHNQVDLTETTGVMRLLVVSMALSEDRSKVALRLFRLCLKCLSSLCLTLTFAYEQIHGDDEEEQIAPTAVHYDK